MTQMIRYMVRMTVVDAQGSNERVVEILAYNKRQAEKKAINGNSNRNSKIYGTKATPA